MRAVRFSRQARSSSPAAAWYSHNVTRPGTCKQSGVATPNQGLTSMWKEVPYA